LFPGVLLLNATLTVRASQANSHANTSGWEKFTDAVIKKVSATQPFLVFLLWGGNAQKKANLIDKVWKKKLIC
jgi:uracil-DNA glycosylase